MSKRYLLVMKSKYGDLKTCFFYTLEEAKITANVEKEQEGLTTIIDCEMLNNEIDTIGKMSEEDIKKAIDNVVNNPLGNKLFKNLSKNN